MSQIVLPIDSPPAPTPSGASPTRTRLDGVDAVRGLVMVLMALDHVRDFMQSTPYRATDLTWTTPALFLSRLMTHLCAPTFILLAGVGIYITQRRKSRGEMVGFLVTRGLWLVLLELTVIRVCWVQNLDYKSVPAAVIWVIGWCMVLMSAMIWLPTSVVGVIGWCIIALHNLTDAITVRPEFQSLWTILHAPGDVKLNDYSRLNVAYVIIPWFGVMCAGYGLGPVFDLDRPTRRMRLAVIGATLLLAFIALRGLNRYGDPVTWTVQRVDPTTGLHYDPTPPTDVWGHFPSPPAPPGSELAPLYTALSFVNTTKYPPSLDYLLMTLGPALLLLAAFDRPLGSWAHPLVVFGRVPLYFYLLHLPLIVGCAAVVYAVGHRLGRYENVEQARRDGLGVSLLGAYLWWLAVVVTLYFPCRWYATLKERSRNPLLTYL
jgi:uncharacterized membrane protein